jgi:acyl-phosphate glycerol 3-phosphate acyltransferase
MLVSLGVLVLSYLVGAVPFSNIVAHRRAGVDLRDVGTGTSGGSNLYTVAGVGAFLLGGFGDLAKGAIGPGLAMLLHQPAAVSISAGALAVIGHNWSVFHRWAGGRGISPAMGAGGVLAWPALVLLALGLSVGRALHATAPACLIAQLLLVPVLWVTHGEYGAWVGVALAVPLLVKRLTGNAPPARWSRQVIVARLVHDRDPGPGGAADEDDQRKATR